MPETLSIVIQFVTMLLVFLLGLLTTLIGWYMKTHVLAEVEKNSKFRRYAGGTDHETDEGVLGDLRGLTRELEELSNQMEAQHTEVDKKVDYVIEYCRRIAEAVEPDISEPNRNWDDGESGIQSKED